MSGTSLDAIDCAVVKFSDQSFELIAFSETGFKSELRNALQLSTVADAKIHLTQLGQLNTQLAYAYSEAVIGTLANAGLKPERIHAIGMHGQTVMHAPSDEFPFTMQLGNTAALAIETGIPVAGDFRSADVAAGGQGAPFAPLFHNWCFGSAGTNTAVVNIGGISNLTLLPSSGNEAELAGFDTGPGNCLMDLWISKHLNKAFDEHGDWSKSGKYSDALLQMMLADPYFELDAPKSTGRDYFTLEWLETIIAGADLPELLPQDIQASLLELTARSIAKDVIAHAGKIDRLICCGGGTRNRQMMSRLNALLRPLEITHSDTHGVQSEAVEAICFAWLAKRRVEHQLSDTRSLTGASRPLLLGQISDPAGLLGKVSD